MIIPSYARTRISNLLRRALADAHLTPNRAATVAGVSSATVWRWVAGRTVPGRKMDPARFWAFLEANGIDVRPFVGLVPKTRAEQGRLWVVCPRCQRGRWAFPSELRQRASTAIIDWKRQRASRVCKRCRMRRLLTAPERINALVIRAAFRPKEWRAIRTGVRRGEAWAKADYRSGVFGVSPRLPRRTPEGQRAIAQRPRSNRSMRLLLKGSRQRSLGLCPLCGLAVEAQRYRQVWSQGTWHSPCLKAWLRWSGQRSRQFSLGQKRFRSPPRPPGVGRPGDPSKLSRDLLGLLRARAHELGYPGGVSVAASAALARTSRQNLNVRLSRIVCLLPADWHLLFRELKPGAHAALQKLVQLPEELASVVEGGGRDALAHWLWARSMLLTDIERMTGMPRARLLALLPASRGRSASK